MRIFKRISDIMTANINDLIDRCEDPEAMLRQAVREMEESLAQAMDAAAKVMAHEKRLQQDRDQRRRKVANWQKQAEQAVRQGNDEQARQALRGKADEQRLIGTIEEQLSSLEAQSRQLRRQVEGMQSRLNEARQKLSVLVARRRAAEARRAVGLHIERFDFGKDAFSRFDRMSETIEQAEAETEARSELAGWPSHAEPESEPDVETELENLKRQMQK